MDPCGLLIVAQFHVAEHPLNGAGDAQLDWELTINSESEGNARLSLVFLRNAYELHRHAIDNHPLL
jgi:hypothetical protein